MMDELVEYDRAAQRTALPERSNGADTPQVGLAIRHILVPLDGSPLAECVLPYVVAVARATEARVSLLQVLEVAGGMTTGRKHIDPLEWEMARAESHAYLAAVAARLESDGISASVELVQGHGAEQICQLAKRQAADLIVLASHGDGGRQAWNLGSTVQKVINAATTSLLVVPAHEAPATPLPAVHLHRMLLPLDCSQRAECILPAVSELARRHGAELLLAHVVPEPEMPRRMGPSKEDLDLARRVVDRNRRAASRYLRDIQNRLAGVSERIDVQLCVASHRAQTLHELAQREGIDLVILSAHGSTGDAHQRYGSVAAKFLQGGYGPVIILQDLAVPARDEHAAEMVRGSVAN